MGLMFIAYRLTILRVAGYFFVPFFTCFLSQTDDWTGEMWDDVHWFVLYRIYLYSTLAGLSSIFAFIDNSLKQAHDRHDALKARRAAATKETNEALE